MTLMTVLTYYGGVQPSEFDEMDPQVATELAQRVLHLYRQEREQEVEFRTEIAKAIIRSNGARTL